MRGNVRPDFYHGLMRGPDQTFRDLSGNDADTASLLVALLRAKGIPARYVRGTARLTTADLLAVTGAVAPVPEAFGRWLKPGGRLFVVRGLSPVQEAVCLTRRGELLHADSLFETDIPYLRGAEPVARFTL